MLGRARTPSSGLPETWTKCAAMLLGCVAWTSGAPAATAFSMSISTGRRLVVDLDQRGRVLRGVAVDRDDHRDGLADVVDVAARQRPLGARVLHRGMRNEQRHLAVEDADIVAGIDRGDARDRLAPPLTSIDLICARA